MKAKFLPVLITRCGIPVIEAREQACISRASLVFSTALPVPSFSTTTFLPRPLWLWPHLLSLEAPLVAVAWTWGLAKLHQMSIMPGVLPGLGLCVWIVYVLDRVLDGIHHSLKPLDVRHEFHRRWRGLLLVAVGIALGILGWLALWVVPAALMWQCVALGLLMLLYLAVYPGTERKMVHRLLIQLSSFGAIFLVHAMPLSPAFKLVITLLILILLGLFYFKRLHERLTSALTKDVAGGLLFALGCTAWIRFANEGTDLLVSLVEFILLSCLFIANLTGISTRGSQFRWMAAGAGTVVGIFWQVRSGAMLPMMKTLATACGIGLALLLMLDWKRKALSAEAYRVWADLAVLAPVLYLWIRA